MIDSYTQLVPEYISKEDFFRFAFDQSIYIPDEKVKAEWESLKKRISSKKPVFMRSAGKSMSDTHFFFDFYKKLLDNENVKKDPSNTQNPSKLIESLTGYKKSKDLKNYQLASPFGRGRNIYAFCAPWNLVYIPKIFDPLMGNEVTSELALEFQKAFEKHLYEKFKPYIDDFNKIVTNVHFTRGTDSYFSHLYDDKINLREDIVKFENALLEDFRPIEV
jgi:hypothetical protein